MSATHPIDYLKQELEKIFPQMDNSFWALKGEKKIGDFITLPNNVQIEIVGGSIFTHGEGDGEHCDIVLKHNEKFYLAPCYYSSYDDSYIYWERLYEVEPYQVIETRYKKPGEPTPKEAISWEDDNSWTEDSWD